MKIEFKAFWPILRDDKKGTLKGTAHVCLPEIGLEIRGCQVNKRKGSYFISWPHKTDYDNESKNKKPFPVIAWSNFSENHEMKKKLIEAVKEYLESHILCHTLEGVIDNSREKYQRKQQSSSKRPRTF